ncbi:MAG: hypothetical protein J0M19_08300 [Sphingomonadales bacterium]|nr:hypothetical protein [Sphingomonadales bacterium]
MTMTKKLMAAAAAFALTASPVLAQSNAAPVREAAPVGQSNELFGDEDGGGWLLFVLLGAAAVIGFILILDDPASP